MLRVRRSLSPCLRRYKASAKHFSSRCLCHADRCNPWPPRPIVTHMEHPPEQPALLSFYRAEHPGTWSSLIRGSVFATLGALIVLVGSLSVFFGVPEVWKLISAGVGASMLLFGLISGFVAVPRALFNESGLMVRQDGLLFQGKADALLLWDSIERITAAPLKGPLTVRLKDGTTHEFALRYGGLAPTDLARKLEQARRRVALNLP
jgi:hypothetical protein